MLFVYHAEYEAASMDIYHDGKVLQSSLLQHCQWDVDLQNQTLELVHRWGIHLAGSWATIHKATGVVLWTRETGSSSVLFQTSYQPGYS